MRRFLTLLLLGITLSAPLQPASVQAQRRSGKAAATASSSSSATGRKAAERITAAELKDYLYFVASDEMEGRDTPSRGLDITAKFIAMNLSRWGVKPAGDGGTYFQKINLQRTRINPAETSLSIAGQQYKDRKSVV